MARDLRSFVSGLKPPLTMVIVQVVFAGVNILYKLCVNDGMNLRILVAYRHIFATAFLGPLAFFLERKTRPGLTWMIIFQSFFSGLFGGSMAQNLYIESLSLTSATFASAMANLVPAITFIMATALGLERLKLKSLPGQAKVFGTAVGICGAMLLTFYKGYEINLWTTNMNLLDQWNHRHRHVSPSAAVSANFESRNRVMGSLLAIGSCFSYSLWLIIQAKMSKRYPCCYSSTALMCLMASIQASLFAFITERDWKQWKLGWDIRLLTVIYSGVFASGLVITVMSWCIQKKGPLYVSVFNPLMLIIVAFVGSLVLDEKLHLGGVLGAALIVIGLYFVLWGKGKEYKELKSTVLPSKNPGAGDCIELIGTPKSCKEFTDEAVSCSVKSLVR